MGPGGLLQSLSRTQFHTHHHRAFHALSRRGANFMLRERRLGVGPEFTPHLRFGFTGYSKINTNLNLGYFPELSSPCNPL